MHVQLDDEQSMHMNHQMSSQKMNNDSGCGCECNSAFGCASFGCHATALLGDGVIKLRVYSQSISRLASAFAPSPDPHLLLRPPIFLF